MTSIVLPGFRGHGEIKLSRITHLRGIGNYTDFYLASGERLLVSQTMKKYADLPGFVRISKSSMVNRLIVERIERIDCKQAYLVTTLGLTLPIARRRIEIVIEEFKTTY